MDVKIAQLSGFQETSPDSSLLVPFTCVLVSHTVAFYSHLNLYFGEKCIDFLRHCVKLLSTVLNQRTVVSGQVRLIIDCDIV